MMIDNSQKVKEKIFKWLKSHELHKEEQNDGAPLPSALGSLKQLRLFTINGLELYDVDNLDVLNDDDYLYYSFSNQQFTPL
jgi:hypothetical protein